MADDRTAGWLICEELESRLMHACTLYFVPAASDALRSTKIPDARPLDSKSCIILFLLYRASLVLIEL